MPDEIMDIRSAAKYLQIKERTLYRLVGEGEIPGIKVGGNGASAENVLKACLHTKQKRFFMLSAVRNKDLFDKLFKERSPAFLKSSFLYSSTKPPFVF
jgi:excisionase family DNA binding protein